MVVIYHIGKLYSYANTEPIQIVHTDMFTVPGEHLCTLTMIRVISCQQVDAQYHRGTSQFLLYCPAGSGWHLDLIYSLRNQDLH